MSRLLFRRPGLLSLLAGATCIGFAPILVRWSEVGPSATAAFRLLFALPLLVVWFLWERPLEKENQPRNRSFLLLCAASGAAFAGDLAFWHWSLQFTTVANSTLFTNFAPFLVTFGAVWILGEKIHRDLIGGLILAFAGGALLVSESLEMSREHLWGDFLGLVTAVFYAIYLLCLKRLREHHPVSLVMLLSGLVSCPLLFIIALASGEKMLPVTFGGWGVLLALAVISHIGGQSLIAHALPHLGAAFASVALLWQAVVAALLAALLLGEKLPVQTIAGGLVVLAGIGLAGGLARIKFSSPVSPSQQR